MLYKKFKIICNQAFVKMTNQNSQEEKIPNFWYAIIMHGFFGIIEFFLILTTIFTSISNIVFLIACISIASALFFILFYALISKNPYYYITCVGLIFITFIPSTIAIIIFIVSTPWSYDPVNLFVLSALILEVLYIIVLIREISYNKYLSYFHHTYTIGYPGRRGSTLRATFYSVKDFDKLDKGKSYWQDQNPEEIQKKKEELKRFKQHYKRNLLIVIQILGILAYNITFFLSLAF